MPAMSRQSVRCAIPVMTPRLWPGRCAASALPGIKEAPLDALLALGYQPLRYRGMAHEPSVSGKEVLTRSIRSRASVVPAPTVGEP